MSLAVYFSEFYTVRFYDEHELHAILMGYFWTLKLFPPLLDSSRVSQPIIEGNRLCLCAHII